MFLKLRIVFTVLTAVCLTLVLPIGAFGGLIGAIATAAAAGIKISEYTPPQVKQAVVGYGKADKHQVIQMVFFSLKARE